MENDPLATVERLASRANGELDPSTEVANRVLATLHSHRPAPASLERDYLLVGAGSFVAACAASVLFWASVGGDSLLSFAQPFVTVIL